MLPESMEQFHGEPNELEIHDIDSTSVPQNRYLTGHSTSSTHCIYLIHTYIHPMNMYGDEDTASFEKFSPNCFPITQILWNTTHGIGVFT
jgi:hypothetical protein